MSMRYPSGFISAFYNPLENPDAPTIGTATSVSSTSLSVTFTAPANVGGGAITGFTAVAKRTSDGVTFTGSGASSPITVTGLSTVAFTVTLFAINSYGPSVLSAASNSVTPTLVIGEAFGGGFFAGQIGTSSVASHNLVVGPLATAETTNQWKNANTSTPGSVSDIDGPQNTADQVADGNSTVYPCAHFCNNLSIGGFSDWYMPAKNELEVCYFNLKPGTQQNSTASGPNGVNPNAVPARASAYPISGPPVQTSAAAFKVGGAQAFTATVTPSYWCSTAFGPGNLGVAERQTFNYGNQNYNSYKNNSFRVRAVRRVAV